MRGTRALASLVAIAFLVTACGGGAAPQPAASATGGQTQTDPCKKVTFEVQTYMAQVQRNGKLRAGVREDDIVFGNKNPTTNRYEGFDIDIVREIAKAIFNVGDDKVDGCIEYTPVVSATRIPSLTDNKVDLVAATMTITADRKKQVDMSDVYFLAHQDILVKKDNTSIKSVTDLNGKTVCAAKGSTSEANIRAKAAQAKLLLLDSYPPCLQALQQDQAQAVSTDDAILAGLVKRDPNTKIVGAPFTDEPYGLAIRQGRTAFLDFVNRTITTLITNGTWRKLYDKHLKPLTGVSKGAPEQ